VRPAPASRRLVSRPAARACLVLSVALLAGFRTGAAESGPLDALIPVLARMQDPQSQLDILKGLSEGLKGQRSAKMPAGWEPLAASLGASTNAELRALAQSLSLTFGSQAALGNLRRQLMDGRADAAARASALEALLGAKDLLLPGSLRRLLSDAALRGPSLRGLAAYDDPLAPAAILAVYPRLNPAEKRDALNTLFSRGDYAEALVAALEKGTVPRADLSADIVRQLRHLRRPELDARLEKVWGKSRESGAGKLKEIARYKDLVLAAGARPTDPARGRAVFSRTCQQCHTLFGVGGKVGPELTGSNRADLNYLMENIVDPNAIIPNDYRTWTLETKDDRVITGILRAQDEKSVTLVTVSETLTVPRPEIRTLQESPFSMMPEGLLTALNDEEIRDLTAYLRSPLQVAPAN
jgi:putative heme-binding domain-containing protein